MLEPEILIVGVGGNLGDDAAILARFAAVVRALEAWSTVRASRVYRTAAIGPEQPDFLNAALAVEPPEDLAASQLLRETQAIELALGRRRADEPRWGPRPIDIDLLLWGPRMIATKTLQIPHPRLAERAFALAPVIDLIGGDAVHPSGQRTFGELLRAVADQRIEPTDYAIDGAVMTGSAD